MVCEFVIRGKDLRVEVPKAVGPTGFICNTLYGIGVTVPFCPFNPDQQAACPLAEAEAGKIPLGTAVRRFYDMAPCLT